MKVYVENRIVELGSCYANGSLMYPGKWVETWLHMPWGVWILVDFQPYKEEK